MSSSSSEEKSGNDVRVFIYHAESEPRTMVAASSTSLAELAAMAGLSTQPDDSIFAEPPADDLDSEADHHLTVEASTRLGTLAGTSKAAHVVVHPCRQIVVTVQYQSQTLQRRFSPARTIGEVRRWALHKLHLDDAAADKLVLQVCHSTKRPGPDVRLASIVGRTCAVCFDLVPDRIVEG